MESMMTNMAPANFYCYNPESAARQHGHFIPHPQMAAYGVIPTLPSTPVYSRPNSSCSQTQMSMQPLRSLTSVPSSIMTPMPSPQANASVLVNGHIVHKPSIMLETELRDADSMRYPSTPPLSTTSTMSSPGSCDMLATPLNPMFSGLDSFHGLKETTEHVSMAAWTSSPPLTPVFVHTQAQQILPMANTHTAAHNELLSVSACPSLSPSPSPYARSIASEQDNDFCDPRDLTVSSMDGDLSPDFSVLSSSLSASGDVEEDYLKTEPMSPNVAAAAVLDFEHTLAHGMTGLDEFPELESEDDFVSGLVNLGVELSTSSVGSPSIDLSRSRASSSLSASSDFECDQFFDTWETSLETEAQQSAKRQRTVSGTTHIFAATAEVQTSDNTKQAAATGKQDSSDNSTESIGSASPENIEGGSKSPAAPVSTNRRGRKQSLTEDPSKIFACDLCNRRFRRQEHLKRHYRSLHTQEKPFSCHECGKKFSRSDNLAQHARTHGAGAFVMNLYDDPEIVAAATGSYQPHPMFAQHAMPMGEDYSGMGRVLFQVAAEIPGSSEGSSDDTDGQSKKKRKRAE